MEMKVKYEFEIDKKEYHKSLCEVCPLLTYDRGYISCKAQEFETYGTDIYVGRDSEANLINARAEIESKCPLEVVE